MSHSIGSRLVDRNQREDFRRNMLLSHQSGQSSHNVRVGSGDVVPFADVSIEVVEFDVKFPRDMFCRTAFHCPTRIVCCPPYEGNSRYRNGRDSCDCPSRVGARLIPSIPVGAFFDPVRSSTVGSQSSKPLMRSEDDPGVTRPGQRTIVGTRTPPSYREPFKPRSSPTLVKKS